MNKFIVGFLAAIILLGGLGGAYYLGSQNKTASPVPSQPPTTTDLSAQITNSTSTPIPTPSSLASETPEPGETMGSVSGKLCYPSQFLPAGTIEAKRLSDNKIFNMAYPGSENGGKMTYSFELEPGTYYLRYKISGNSIGYSTTICPTGLETACSDTKKRELTQVKVLPGKESLNYNLCDFYYTPQNKPDF